MRVIAAAVTFFVVVGAVIAIGPRVQLDLDDVPAAPAPPAELDGITAWLADAESKFDDITPGAEKHVAFATPSAPAKTPLAIVYLHGFSATRQETHPLTERIAATLNANVYYARLAGHGRGSAPLSAVNAREWLADTREALAIGQLLGERVVVIGVSTGATLATWLAMDAESDALSALVLVSPNYGLTSRSADVLTMPWGLNIARAIAGNTRSFEAINEAHGRYWTSSYEIRAAAEMMALVTAVNAAPLEKITVPTLLVRSDRDVVIDMAKADQTVERFSSATRGTVVVTESTDPWGHVIAGDIMSPESTDVIATAVIDFVRRLSVASVEISASTEAE
ncbi:MAG: alpha/beta fold hydrolase [Pseudomonadota bacterium]